MHLLEKIQKGQSGRTDTDENIAFIPISHRTRSVPVGLRHDWPLFIYKVIIYKHIETMTVHNVIEEDNVITRL